MRISARARITAATLAIAAAALPAIEPATGQATGQDRPESLLPPGVATIQRLPGVVPTPSPSATPSGTPTPTAIDPAILAEYEMPASARRSLALVGPAGVREGALGPDAFGRADGRYLETLMRRVAAPLPSRWLSILLRRTLAAQLTTPANVDGADFAAERAWLLLRMGESVAARAVVQGIDNDRYTGKLYQVAMNTALATGDPAELCLIADAGFAATRERGWTLAQSMCAALSGNAAQAKAQIAVARRRGIARGIDLQLAQKVVGAGPNGGQAVTIEWAGVDILDAWRFGLAVATGVVIPADMFATTGAQALSWYALAPSIGLGDRVAASDVAAGQGVLSSAALVDFYGAVDAADDMPAVASATAQDLRSAYIGDTAAARLAAMKQLWGGRDGALPAYPRLVLTARAAARLPVRTALDEAPGLVASMLTAGLDRSAARWRDAVPQGGDAWAMIALSDPDLRTRLSYSDLSGYSGSGNAALKQRMLFAGLAGLGRMAPDDIERAATALDVRIGAQNVWTRALDRAAADNEQGTVVLLAAIGMQTPTWRGVPPEMLYRIVGALRAVGLEGEARMIAAEAIARV